jgi:DNA invertase Pin-like site-specific DNA recombinase
VSTDSDEQQNSYEAQVAHFEAHIKANPEWEFVSVYTDSCISATSTKNRDGFNTMIKDALDGKLDLIITKSVSRFARNTVDSLTAVRQLKERGIEVYFEKENISTLDGKGELLITIMSSLAQEESRSISENVRWGQRRSFEKGRVYMPYTRFLGFEKGEDGVPKIVEKEAETVRLIYGMYLQGKTVHAIARHLTEQGIPTPGGKTDWSSTTVSSILTSEKMKGCALLQKVVTTDFITKKRIVNDGRVPQYYVENSHPAIISPEVHDLVQQEIKRRKAFGTKQTGLSPFSSKIICGSCGEFFGPKVWNSTNKYRRVIWRCNHKYKGDSKCETPHITEDAIKRTFVDAFNRIAADKTRIVGEYESIIAYLTDTTDLDKEIATLTEECSVVRELLRNLIECNTFTASSQDEYLAKYEGLMARHDNATERLTAANDEKRERSARRETLSRFLDALRQRDGLLTEFDENLWCVLVESLTVAADGGVTVKFRDGREV